MSRKARTREYMELLNELESCKEDLREATHFIESITASLGCAQTPGNKLELENELEDWEKVEQKTENTIESIEARLECLYDDGIDVEEVARCREEGIVA